MKEQFSKLIDVKSIITILLTAVFCYLAIANELSQEFMTIFTVVVSFYFGTQSQKTQAQIDEIVEHKED